MGLFDQVDEAPPRSDDKNRLFETQAEITGFNQHYSKLLLAVAALVLVAGAIIYFVTLPAAGDKVRPPKGLEEAVRTHFLEKQKRTATDITFFYCVDYYTARVDVETRYDIPGNPLAQIPTYWAKAVGSENGGWQITVPPNPASVYASEPCRGL